MKSIKVVQKSQYDDVLIVFSSRNMAMGKFTLEKQLIAINFPANIIFVNDYSNQYYLQGTPEFKSKLDFLHIMIRKVNQLKRKYGKLFIFGSSMGGYAALLYGSLLQADKILAFGVESELGLLGGHSNDSLLESSDITNSSLSKLNFKNPKDICIIAGNENLPDLCSASKLKTKNNKLNIKLINNYNHVVAKYIQERISLPIFIRQFFINNSKQIFQNMDVLNPPQLKDSKALFLFDQSFKKNMPRIDLKQKIYLLAKNYPTWSLVHFYTAYLYFDEGDRKNSKKHLMIAIENLYDDLSRTRLKLATLYCEDLQIKKGIKESEILKNSGIVLEMSNLLINLYNKEENA